jgi:hypothetical protein
MKLFKEMFGELSAWGRFWLYLGLATLVCAAAMSFAFGMEISIKHALFLMCLTAIAAFLPEAAYSQWVEGRRIVSMVLGLVAIPTLMIEFYTHAGYTAGLRGSNIETAMVQNTKWTGAQEAVSEDKTNVELWKKQLATLMEQNAWAGTVKADGLRASLDSAQKAIDLEASRGGCKAKCLAQMEKKADLEKRIAIAEQASDLTKRIEATQRILDNKRTAAATTEHKSSAVEHQNKFLAKSIAMVSAGSLTPTEFMSEGSQQTVNLAMALAGTGLPALALFIAGLYRNRRDDDQPTAHAVITHEAPAIAPRQQDGHSKPAPVTRIHAKSVGECAAEVRAILNSHRAQAA